MADGATPSYIDTSKASIARVYDAALGGKDNYEIDRETLAHLMSVAPEVPQSGADNRGFLIRAVRFLAGKAGIAQFLDCGSGLPTAENTHQVAQRINPEARVVYVDNDPSVIAHGQALLADNERTMFSSADIFEPSAVLGDPDVRAFLDLDEPVALIHNGTLHHYDDPARSPQSIVGEYIDGLVSGSYLSLSHLFDPENEDSDLARRLEQVYINSPMGSGSFRTRAEIEAMFPGLEMVPPGIVGCADWWPDGPRLIPLSGAQRCVVGGVGRKP